MSETTNLRLPLMAAAQAQKHVTHNEALLRLDALIQLEVLDKERETPPSAPVDGDRYIVAGSGADAWAGQGGHIAAWQDGAWRFYLPQNGWRAYVRDENALYVKTTLGWQVVTGSGGGTLQNVPLFGLGTEADAANPFAARLDKALWTARSPSDGGSGDLRYTLNKDGMGNVLSLLFQSGWAGRAEAGLIGDDDFIIKVSADGNAWNEAMRIDNATGRVSCPKGVPTSPWVTLANAATITPDLAAGDKFRVVASGTRTIAKPLNLTDGARFLLSIRNSVTMTLTLDAVFAPLSGSMPTFRSASGQFNSFDCVYDAVDDRVYYVWF